MRTLWSLLFLLFAGSNAFSQTFADCSISYHQNFNKVQLQRTTKKIQDKEADSLLHILAAEMDQCIIGKKIGDYKLVGRSGTVYTPESLKGKVVMLNFWFVGCGPCMGEIPVLNKLQNAYKDNDEFILISILPDNEVAMERLLNGGLTKIKINYEVVPGAKDLFKGTFKMVKAWPTNLFLDKDGKIFRKETGGIMDPQKRDQLEATFKSIIDGELANDGPK